jgi:hypothetical protein
VKTCNYINCARSRRALGCRFKRLNKFPAQHTLERRSGVAGLTLNVGCGIDPWGDVRVDVSCSFIDLACKPDVLADAHALPFRDGVFSKVKSHHVLEHLKYPAIALNELTRVATHELLISFPTEADVFPFIASVLFPIPRFAPLRFAVETRRQRLHLWIVKPKAVMRFLNTRGWSSTCRRNTFFALTFFAGGRKERYFKWLVRTVRIPFEYEILARRISPLA